MKLDIFVLALLASQASAACIFGFGCNSTATSGNVNGYQLAVDTGSATASQTAGSINNGNTGSATNTFMTAATTSYTSVTADGGTNGISAFPATTWTGPHLRSTTTNNYNPAATNNNNESNGDSNNNNGGSHTNAGAIAGGVIGGLIVIGAAAGLVFFLVRRSRQKRQNESYGTRLSENDFAPPAAAIAGPTLPSAYNEPTRYDNGRRFVQQKNPHPPPIGFSNITPTQKAPAYTAEYGQSIEKPSEDTENNGMWKPDVQESKPNV